MHAVCPASQSPTPPPPRPSTNRKAHRPAPRSHGTQQRLHALRADLAARRAGRHGVHSTRGAAGGRDYLGTHRRAAVGARVRAAAASDNCRMQWRQRCSNHQQQKQKQQQQQQQPAVGAGPLRPGEPHSACIGVWMGGRFRAAAQQPGARAPAGGGAAAVGFSGGGAGGRGRCQRVAADRVGVGFIGLYIGVLLDSHLLVRRCMRAPSASGQRRGSCRGFHGEKSVKEQQLCPRCMQGIQQLSVASHGIICATLLSLARQRPLDPGFL